MALLVPVAVVVVILVALVVVRTQDDHRETTLTAAADHGTVAGDQDPASADVATTTTTAPPPPTTPPTTRPPRDIGRILLMGDSVADTLSDQLAGNAAVAGLRFSDQTVPGCGVITGLPTESVDTPPVPWGPTCERAILSYQPSLAHARSAGTVLWLSSWETSDRWVDGRALAFGTPEADEVILELMDQTRARILAGSDALLVLVKLAPPAAVSEIGPADADKVRRVIHLGELFDRFAAEHPVDTRVLDMGPIVCPTGPPCPPIVDGIPLRPTDGGHFSPAGAAWVAPRLLDEIIAVAG